MRAESKEEMGVQVAVGNDTGIIQSAENRCSLLINFEGDKCSSGGGAGASHG